MTKKSQPQADACTRQADLASLLSHELRTPLNAIIGFAEMLDGEVLGDVGNQRYREYARYIRDSGTHLSDIISDLLNAIPSDGSAPPSEPIDPLSAIDDCMGLLKREAGEAGVRLQSRRPDSRFRLLADGKAVTKILTLLVRDAISSAHRGERIMVSVDLATGRQGLAYSIKRPLLRSRRILSRTSATSRGPVSLPPPLQPAKPDLGPAIWNWLVRLNGGRLDLDRAPDSCWTARVGFPERMVRRLRKPLGGNPKMVRN